MGLLITDAWSEITGLPIDFYLALGLLVLFVIKQILYTRKTLQPVHGYIIKPNRVYLLKNKTLYLDYLFAEQSKYGKKATLSQYFHFNNYVWFRTHLLICSKIRHVKPYLIIKNDYGEKKYIFLTIKSNYKYSYKNFVIVLFRYNYEKKCRIITIIPNGIKRNNNEII